MMKFIDKANPPEKGSFEYKDTTINTFGRIFQYDEIGKYSVKIKSILNNIYNKEEERVSQGVILIYSQYIDSGLIPMALALEEMGFTRYTDNNVNVKPLFKNKPTEAVDVRTMKPRPPARQSQSSNFFPARYTMITGDIRLSPNNNEEVKAITSKENVNGNKIKVVLISRAGSEGIDFKYIRQVHILDPWYNMNRIEQIIGRAVRNFSHKDLVFEKRNVEIFMHGTMIEDTPEEEPVDLYIYRIAEYKAIQIGKITRILKETAVDCIINHEQTNFIREKISEKINNSFRQELSNGMILSEFKIGDTPFSAACDYMEQCYYSCKPMDTYEENIDTYNENFIRANMDKISQRIRMLMKESYFYEKEKFMNAIRIPKEYPYSQIYYCITQMIEDKQEITDKYGRTGTLVNIANYYLFQPAELDYKNTSIWERSTPLDYKHNVMNIIMNKNINNSREEDGEKVFREIEQNIELIYIDSEDDIIEKSDENWYIHCRIAMYKIKEILNDIKDSDTDIDDIIMNIITSHIIESLLFDDKLDLMNYLYSLETISANTLEWRLKNYFDIHSIKTKDGYYFILFQQKKMMIMQLQNKKWVEIGPEEQRLLTKQKETLAYFTMDEKNYNNTVGFMGYDKQNKTIVFKTKNLDAKRERGARCDESGKKKIIKLLNTLLRKELFTNENTKVIRDKNKIIQPALISSNLCIIQEFILRYYNDILKDNKLWFFTPELALYHKLYELF